MRRRIPSVGRGAARRAALIVACAAASAAPASDAPPSSAPLWETSGSGCESDPRLEGVRRTLEETLPAALRGLEERLGVSPGSRERVRIRWKLDLALRSGGGDGRFTTAAPHGLEAGRTAFEGGDVVVTLPARKYLWRPAWAVPVVWHEAAHGVMASAAGSRETYESAPAWFREGIAIWFAGEGEARVREAIAWSLFEGRPADAFLRGIDFSSGRSPAAASAENAAEAFLAVRWLESEMGLEGLRALVRRAVEGKPLVPLVEEALGAGPGGLRGRALDRGRSEVRRLVEPRSEELFARSLALRARGDAAAAGIWAELLERDPRGPLVSTLQYLMARDAIEHPGRGGTRAAARASLEKTLALPDALWRPESLVLLGECLYAEGDARGAEALWRDVEDAWNEDPLPASRARANLERLKAGTPRP